MLDPITLLVNGREFGGWESVTVTASANEAVRSFKVTTSERMPDWPIQPMDEASVLVNGADVLVKGFVDDYEAELDATSHTVTISGRGKTCDLVDCSAIHETGRFENMTIEQIGNALAQRYGVKLVVKAKKLEKLDKFQINLGESAFDALERIARQQDLLLVGAADGSLEIHDQPEGLIGQLIEGENFLSMNVTLSSKDRHKEYTVKGQRSFTAEATDLKIEKKAVDGKVKRIRSKVIIAEGDITNEAAEKRAKNELTTRAGNSIKATAKVTGFYAANGELWTPLKKLYVYSPTLHIDQTMAIESCEFSKDANDQTTTTLSLVDPRALKEKKKDSRSKSAPSYDFE